MKIILTSKSKIKEEAVKKWQNEIIKKNIQIKKIEINNNFSPEQPINSGIEKICENRISIVEELYPKIVLQNNYILSIENGIKIKNNLLIDIVCIKLKNIANKEIKTYIGSPIIVDSNKIEKYPMIKKIINDFIEYYKLTNGKYNYDGSSITFGSLVNKYYPEIPSNNWMKILNKKDRILQIFDVLCCIDIPLIFAD